MATTRIHPNVLKFCAWLGPLFTLWWLVGVPRIAQVELD